MRVTLPILAVLNIGFAAYSALLVRWGSEPLLLDNRFVYWIQLAAAGGFVLALVTLVAAAVATAQRRQFGWLGALIVAWVIAAAGSYLVLFVFPPALYHIVLDPCPPQYHCTPPPPDWLPWVYLLGLPLFGLVVLLYRFFMRAPAAAPTQVMSS